MQQIASWNCPFLYTIKTLNTQSKPLLPYIFLTALIAGVLDGAAAIIHYLAQGRTNPGSIFKYIASGLFGKKAFAGGNEMIAWGLALHFFIALSFTLLYFVMYPRVKWLRQDILVSAVIYGLFVWAVMNLVVVRLSISPAPVLKWEKALVAMGILIFCIGLPLAIMARKYYLYKK